MTISKILILSFIIITTHQMHSRFIYLKNDSREPLTIKVNGRVVSRNLMPRREQKIEAEGIKNIALSPKFEQEFQLIPFQKIVHKYRDNDVIVRLVPGSNGNFAVGKITVLAEDANDIAS